MSLTKEHRTFLETLIREGGAQQYHMRQKVISRRWADFTHAIHCLLVEVDRLTAIEDSRTKKEDVIPKGGYFIEEEYLERLNAARDAAPPGAQVVPVPPIEEDESLERMEFPGITEAEFYDVTEATVEPMNDLNERLATLRDDSLLDVAPLKLESQPTVDQLQEEELFDIYEPPVVRQRLKEARKKKQSPNTLQEIIGVLNKHERILTTTATENTVVFVVEELVEGFARMRSDIECKD